jgi:hypothetical protein
VIYFADAFAGFLIVFAGFQLWSAAARGQILNRTGGWVTRAEQPASFWMNVAINVWIAVLPTLIVGYPVWRTSFPQSFAQRISNFYPAAAVSQHVAGRAVVSCTVTASYRLRDCEVLQVFPAGYHFGEAALKVASVTTLPERDRPRAQPGGKINLPVRFALPVSAR